MQRLHRHGKQEESIAQSYRVSSLEQERSDDHRSLARDPREGEIPKVYSPGNPLPVVLYAPFGALLAGEARY